MRSVVQKTILFGTLAVCWCSLVSAGSEEIKAYYEQKKSIFEWTFKAPEIGSKVTVTLRGGESHSGVLNKLSDKGVQLISEETVLTYKRQDLQEDSRILLFAEDYAHAKALKSVQAYKEKQKEGTAPPLLMPSNGASDGTLTVKVKTKKTATQSEENSANTSGSRDVETKSWSKVLDLTISIVNRTSLRDTYSLEWYFFAQSVDHDEIVIHERGFETIKLNGGQEVKRKVSSKKYTIQKVATNSTSSGYGVKRTTSSREEKSGFEEKGYLVILTAGDEVLDRKASTKRYLDPGWLEKCR